MLDIIKKSMEIGLGAVTITREKLQEITDDLVVRGNLSKKEGGEILNDLLKSADEGQKRMKSLVEEKVHAALKEAGIATKEDVKALEGKIAKLEAIIAKKKSK